MIDRNKPLPPQIAALSYDELLETACRGKDSVRALAFTELARLSLSQPRLVKTVANLAATPENRNARLLGTISVAHYGLTELLRANPAAASSIILPLLADWPEPDRSDFFWYVKSELGPDALAQMVIAA